MKALVTVCVCILIPYSVFAQSRAVMDQIDLAVLMADSLREEGAFSMSEKVARSGLERSQKTNYFKGLADCFMQIGRALKEQEKFEDALKIYESALIIRRDQLHDNLSVAKTYNSMTSAALDMGEPLRALKYSTNALEFCPKDKIEVLAKIYTNRANLYEDLDSVEMAINLNRLSIDLFQQTHDTLSRLQTGYGLAKRLINISLFPEAKKEITSILQLIHTVEQPDSSLLGDIFEIYGNYFYQRPDCQADSAIVYFQEAARIYQKRHLPNPQLTNIYFNLGEAYIAKNDLGQAKEFYQKSLQSLSGGDNDGLFGESLQAIIGRIEAQENLIAAQKRELYLKNFVLLCMIIITVGSLILYNNTRLLLKKEKENTRLTQQNFQLKHDIVKNGLQAIDNHIKAEMHDLDGDPTEYAALKKVENMVSRMLNKVGYPVAGTQEATTLKPFVRELHLQAEEIFRGAQNYSYLDGVDDYAMSKELRDQLEAIVTESFTNIYKHANCTVASLCVEVDENGFTLTIEDNGNGFNPEEVKQSGLRNIELRAHEIKGRSKITTAPGKGTKIKIVIPSFPEQPE